MSDYKYLQNAKYDKEGTPKKWDSVSTKPQPGSNSFVSSTLGTAGQGRGKTVPKDRPPMSRKWIEE